MFDRIKFAHYIVLCQKSMRLMTSYIVNLKRPFGNKSVCFQCFRYVHGLPNLNITTVTRRYLIKMQHGAVFGVVGEITREMRSTS